MDGDKRHFAIFSFTQDGKSLTIDIPMTNQSENDQIIHNIFIVNSSSIIYIHFTRAVRLTMPFITLDVTKYKTV